MMELDKKPDISNVNKAIVNIGYVIESREQDLVIEWNQLLAYVSLLEEALKSVYEAADMAVTRAKDVAGNRV
jgi:hypothetical protein